MCAQADPKQTTEKYGLEAGLWQIFTSKDPVTGKTKGDQAKDLLKKYGSAYLITSISFAIVSFAACYALVNAGLAPPSALTCPCVRRSCLRLAAPMHAKALYMM